MANDSGIPGHLPHQLAAWWEHGEGAAKIAWGTPGSFMRCVRLAEDEAHMTPERAKGFCADRYHAATGKWPGEHHHHAGRSATVADKKPYGNVTYADPRNGKYPIDTEAHCRAAWSYINMPKNAAMYPLNGVTLSEVKGRIKAALKKYGADVSDSDSDKASASRSEIVRPFMIEDLHIMRSAEGDGTGRVVEGYAAVFEDPTFIHDHQGDYEEIIDRRAFDAALAKMQSRRGGIASAVRVLFNHGKTIEGNPAPEFQKPIGKPLEVRPDSRGLLTRTEFNRTPLAEEVLEMIRSQSITGMSFVGSIVQSDPELRGPGDKYRRKGGAWPRVRRMMLGLREYSPVVYEAYSGAAFLGMVRMGLPESFTHDVTATDGGFTEFEEYAPADEGDGAGSAPEDATSSRYHQHVLYAMRSREMREAKGLVL